MGSFFVKSTPTQHSECELTSSPPGWRWWIPFFAGILESQRSWNLLFAQGRSKVFPADNYHPIQVWTPISDPNPGIPKHQSLAARRRSPKPISAAWGGGPGQRHLGGSILWANHGEIISKKNRNPVAHLEIWTRVKFEISWVTPKKQIRYYVLFQVFSGCLCLSFKNPRWTVFRWWPLAASHSMAPVVVHRATTRLNWGPHPGGPRRFYVLIVRPVGIPIYQKARIHLHFMNISQST